MAEDRELRVRSLLDTVRAEGRTALTAPEGKVIADAYGIAVPGEELATDVDEAVSYAARFGGPVVMKIVSPDILHKTDAGGVIVGVEGAADIRAAFYKIIENARAYNASARIEGVALCAGAEPDRLVAGVGNSHRRSAGCGDDQPSRPRGDRECGRVAVRARRKGEREQRGCDREQECELPHRATTVNVTEAE